MSMDDQIIAALETIHDPCSIAAGRPLSLRAMGLVRGWQLEEGVLTVTFAVTFPGCTMAPHFTEAARVELLNVGGIDVVHVRVDTEYVWTPDDMPALALLHGQPQAWRDRIG